MTTAIAPDARISNPIAGGTSLDAASFRDIRRRMVLDDCKWDPQVGDVATLADFPLLISQDDWKPLARDAEALSAELTSAEDEVLRRPHLLKMLGLPLALRRALRQAKSEPTAPRVMRFDFHWTREGWRVSEVNSDVPGGYAEAGPFTELMADASSAGRPSGHPGREWSHAVARTTSGESNVALIAAAGFMEDQQVVAYLAKQLRSVGLPPHIAQVAQLSWNDNVAHFTDGNGSRKLGAIVRFQQTEWLSRRATRPLLHQMLSSHTPITNPLRAIVGESKRFPLVWDHLETRSDTWRALLPQTRAPHDAPWRSDDGWLLKTAFCNTGDSVSIREFLTPRQWRSVKLDVLLHPRQWIAQRRFETVPIDTPLGSLFPCIGVYTLNGETCGAYARLSRGPIVNFAAMDAALLIRDSTEGKRW
jgi:glutathionylspermidine synthase